MDKDALNLSMYDSEHLGTSKFFFIFRQVASRGIHIPVRLCNFQTWEKCIEIYLCFEVANIC